jgi:hypothetical protein
VSQPLELSDRYDHHGLFVLARDHLRSAFPRPTKYLAELHLGGLQLPPLDDGARFLLEMGDFFDTLDAISSSDQSDQA